jgi:hypothetical protein
MAGLSSDPMRWIGETQVTISCWYPNAKSQKWFYDGKSFE